MNTTFDSNTAKLFFVAAVFGWFVHPGYVIAVGTVYKAALIYAEVNAPDSPIVSQTETIGNSVVDYLAITAGALTGRYLRNKIT